MDNLISAEDNNNGRTNVSVLYGTIMSDHIPLIVNIDLKLAPDNEHRTDIQ